MDYWLLIYLYQCSANNAVLATVLSGKGLNKESLKDGFICSTEQNLKISLINFILLNVPIHLDPCRNINNLHSLCNNSDLKCSYGQSDTFLQHAPLSVKIYPP